MVARAPAKLNLHLTVGPRRADDFHDLTTVFHAVSLTDDVTVRAGRRAHRRGTRRGRGRGAADGTDLAARAVRLLAGRTGCDPAVAIRIDKGIPVAGGCAGGSADAAAALVACDALWGTGLSRDELAAIGAQLGSDVPFALHGGTALGTGRGERLTPVLGAGSYAWVLALADGGLSTPAVYARAGPPAREPGRSRSPATPPRRLAALRSGDAAALGAALSNDLQAAALVAAARAARVVDAGARARGARRRRLRQRPDRRRCSPATTPTRRSARLGLARHRLPGRAPSPTAPPPGARVVG